jgi:type I restriction enzyme S subunit
VSELPKGWVETSIEDVCYVNPRRDVDLDLDDLVSFVPMPALDEFSGEITRPIQRPLRQVAKGFTQFLEGDVLFAKITPSMENGKSAVARHLTNGTGFGSTEFHVLRSTGVIEPDYLWRYLRQQEFRDNAAAVMTGAVGQLRVPTEYLKKHPIPLAPLTEQRRIVAKLDELLARTARARADLDRIPILVSSCKQALLASAFSGGLTAGWRLHQSLTPARPEEIRAVVKQERDKQRAAEGVRSKGANRNIPPDIADPPPLPKGWAWLTFEECSWDLTVGHVGPMKDRYVPSGTPFLRSLNVKPNRIDLTNIVYIGSDFDRELHKSRLKAGTIVVVRTGAPGVAAVIPPELDGANCSDLVICRPVNSVNPHYAAYFINSAFAQNVVAGFQVGVAQQHFNVGAMSKLALPYAPFEEQCEIVFWLDTAFGWLDRLAAERGHAMQLLPHLDQAILAKAFRGELVPQDPRDKPASELLARSRVARAEAPKRIRRVNPRATGEVVTSEIEPPTLAQKEQDMDKTRKDVPANHLCEVVKKAGGEIKADALWRASEMQIDEFYKLLRDDIAAKRLKETADKVSITDAR